MQLESLRKDELKRFSDEAIEELNITTCIQPANHAKKPGSCKTSWFIKKKFHKKKIIKKAYLPKDSTLLLELA